MKSTQLLSVVFSLIMFTGITAGNTAFAESDDLDDILERFCEMTGDEQSDILADYGLDDYADRLAEICTMVDNDEREESLDVVIDEIYLKINVVDELDDFETEVEDEVEDETDEECDDDSDYASDGRHYNLDERLAHFCDMSDEETRQFFTDHPRLAQFSDRLANYCDLSDYSRDSKLKDFIRQNITDEDREQVRDYVKDHMKEKYDDSDIDSDFREKLAAWCEMTDEEKSTTAAEYGKTEDQIAKADRYCTLDESDRADFIDEHRDEFRAHIKDRMHDKMTDKPHMDYDRLCVMLESDHAVEIDDSEKLDRISEWCEMTPEERKEYKMKHHDGMDRPHDFDKMSDVAKEKHHDKMEKFSEKSDRLKVTIMDKRDISDERHDEIRMKFEEKHGEDSDKKRSEIKMKYKDHMKHMKFKMSDERKSDVHERLAEMNAYKAELRANSSELSDEEKQQLREEFIEKAKDMQLAWLSPRTQMTAGIDSAEVECREGFSLVMKASNGVAMCLKADTALKMMDRGIVVPAI